MSCKSLTSEYTEVVKNLIKSNPKYRSYDEAAAIVLNSDTLDNNQKKQAVHYFASIYKGLTELDAKSYTAGKLQDVLDLAPRFNDTKAYLASVSNIYDVAPDSATPREKAIAKLEKYTTDKISTLSLKDINTLLDDVIRYFNTVEFESDEALATEVENFKKLFGRAIEINGGTKRNKGHLTKRVIETTEALINNTDYVDINEFPEFFAAERRLVALKNGSIVQGVEKEGFMHRYDPATKQESDIIPADQIDWVKPIRKDITQQMDFGNGEIVILSSAIEGGFTIRPIDGQEVGKLHSTLNSIGSGKETLEIKAVALYEVGDERVDELKEKAESDPKLAKLSNRSYETYESPSQVEILKSDKTAEVITVRRPNKSDKIAFIGTIKGTDLRFNLFNLDNYTIVDASNNTTPFDFNNPEHIKLLKKMSVKTDGYKNHKSLSNEDVDKMIKAYNDFQDFKKKAEAMLAGNPSVDVTELFFSQYEAEVQALNQKDIPLPEMMESDPQISTEVTTVIVNRKGQVVKGSEEKTKLPIHFTSTYNRETESFEYQLRSVLPNNVRILDKDGNPMNEQSWVTNFLGVTEERGFNDILDSFYHKTQIDFINERGQHHAPRFVLKMNKHGKPVGYRSVNYVTNSYYGSGFMRWAFDFVNLDPSKPSTVKDFDIANTFNLYNIQGQFRPALRANIQGIHFTNKETGKLQSSRILLEIRSGIEGFPTELDEYINKKTKSAFNIELHDALAKPGKKTGILEGLKNRMQSIQDKYYDEIVAEYPELAGDMSTAEGQKNFYEGVYGIYAELEDVTPKMIVELINRIEKMSVDFSNHLANLVDNKVKDNFEAIIKAEVAESEDGTSKLLDILKKYYKHTGEGNSMDDFNFRRLVVDENSGVYLSVMEQANIAFSKTPKYITVYQSDKRQMVISSKRNPKITQSHTYKRPQLVKSQSENTKEQDDFLSFIGSNPSTPTNNAIAGKLKQEADKAEKKKQTPPTQPPSDPSNDTDFQPPSDDAIFSIEEEAETQEGLPQAQAWLAEALPQFGLEISDLQDVVDLSTINGNVLGIYKDRTIFLNKELAGAGTLYHEAFHGVFRNLMDAQRREELIDAVRSNAKYDSKFTDAAVDEFARDRGYNYDRDKTRRIIAEEILADGFKEYMQKNTKPSGIIARLFEALKKLLSFFSANSDVIDRAYSDIRQGVYSTTEMRSELYTGEYALESIPGVVRHYETKKGEYFGNRTLEGGVSSSHKNNLINVLASNIIQDTTEDKFSEKFDRAADMLIKLYDIDKIVENAPSENEAAIRAKWSGVLTNFRFMLGARMNEAEYGMTYDENRSGNPAHDKYKTKQIIKLPSGAEIDNTLGAHSKRLLKAQVKQTVEAIQAVDIDFDNDEANVQDILSGEQAEQENTIHDAESDSTGVDSGGKFDDGMGNEDVVNQVKYVRSLMATVEINEPDELGVTLPKVVDAVGMFPVLLKITSNLDAHNTIERINIISKQLLEDGYTEEHYQIQAIYDRIASDTGLDENGLPTRNHHVYDMFVEVLNNIELDYTMFDIITPEKLSESQLAAAISKAEQKHRVDIKDSVLASDIKNMKDEFVRSMVLAYSNDNKEAVDKHRAAAKDLQKMIRDVIIKSKNLFIGKGIQEVKLAEEYTERLHTAMAGIGLNLPKSLVRLSLIGIDAIENESYAPTSKELSAVYDLHENVLLEDKYLSKDFFRSLDAIIETMYLNDNKTSQNFLKYIDEDIKQRGQAGFMHKSRFFSILKKASEYVLKYNPQKIQSVIKNAEGKNIYRYAKYNPLLQMAQMVRRHGLQKMLKSDPYYAASLKAFMMDNPAVGSYLQKLESGEAMTKEDLKIEEFLKHIHMSMLGGVQQRVGDKLKEGKSFKNIDTKSQYLIYLAAFMNRETAKIYDEVTGEEIDTISMFKRQYHQLESTQTNFLITGLYKSFIDNSMKNTGGRKSDVQKAGAKMYEGKYLAIVEDLMGIIKQEYNRILKETAEIGDKVSEFNKGKGNNQLVLKYNAKYNKDGSVDVTDPGLRAFKFNRLQTFWGNNTTLIDKFEAAAKEGVKFEDIAAEELTNLKAGLHDYAMSEWQSHLNKLIQNRVIEAKKGSIITDPSKGTTMEFDDFSSPYLPKELRVDFNNVDLKEQYGSAARAGNDTGLYGLMFDAFMNTWYNTLNFNQMFDGDPAMGTKSDVDYVKRLKKFAASGPNMKFGTHTVAYTTSIEAWTHQSLVQYGPYTSLEQIKNDVSITDEAVREQLLQAFDSDSRGETSIGKWYPIFDGQSISSLMHQMDQFKTFGRLTPRAKQLLIKKHYMALTPSEVNELKAMRIVNNSKKTVTASRYAYHKLSEYNIDRNDVSNFIFARAEGMTDAQYEQARKNKLQEIHNMYSEIYTLREDIQRGKLNGAVEDEVTKRDRIQELTKLIHENFAPKKHRKALHDLLNSMEYHQIDQMMDVEASKNATLMPLQMTTDKMEGGYYNFAHHSLEVQNVFKYLQVETSGVKEKAKVGVQKKVLLPADVQLLIDQLGSETLTEEERKSLTILGTELSRYNSTLKAGFDARFNYLQNVVREGGNLDVGKMYKLIQQSLESQGAPLNQIKMFDLKSDGTPVVNPNLPMVRKMVEYFFFSHYSQHTTDEKASGFKSFHISGYGWDVVVDRNNNVITTEEYDKNPQKYESDEYTSRPLTVSVEEIDGVKTYWTEVIVPMPQFSSEKEKVFYMESMRKAFGTRIPTEDKRSMIAMKIVDFIDASKLNSVIVPQYVHVLAGSDFDIDSLFGQMYAKYQNAKGDYVKYGDYSAYKNQKAGEFIEFLHYMESKPEFKKIIEKKRRALHEDANENMLEDGWIDVASTLVKGSPMYTMLEEAYGFTEAEIEEAKSIQDMVFTLKELKKEIKELHAAKENIKSQIWDVSGEKKRLENAEQMHADMKAKNAEKFAKIAEKKELYNDLEQANEILDYVYAYQPIIETLTEFALPITFDSYKDPKKNFNMMVSPRHQNENLDASLKMLSNEHIFNRLYIQEKTSDDLFREILRDVFGITVDDVIQKGDINTIDSIIESKADTSSFKDGIGISANINKFLSIASSYQLELERPIWSYYKTEVDADGKTNVVLKQHTNFHELNEKQQRPIQIIGGILGVFADAAKDPIPTALQLNEVNTNVALVMAALGMDPGMVMGFGFMPEIRNAVAKVRESKEAVTEDFTQELVWFNGAVDDEVLDLLTDKNNSGFRRENATWTSLLASGLVEQPKRGAPSPFRWNVNTNKLVIDFDYKKAIDITNLKTNTLSLSQIGFNVTTVDGTVLTEDVQKAVLLNLYSKQVSEIWNISKATKLTNFHKRLNPNIQAFDKTLDGFQWLQSEDSIFTEESMNRLLGEDSVYKTIVELAKDMDEQLSNLFLERQSGFSNINTLFGQVFNDKATMSDIFTGVAASRSYLNSILAQDPSKFKNPVQRQMVEDEIAALKELMDPANLFTGKLGTELDAMKKKYPDNRFLQKLKVQNGIASAILANNKGTVKETNVSMIDKIKLKDQVLEDTRDDLMDLYASGMEAKLFVKKLFFNEVLRTGGQMKDVKGAYMNLFPSELIEAYSAKLNDIFSLFNYSNKIIESRGKYYVNGKEYKTKRGAEKFLSQVKNQVDVEGSLNLALGENYRELLEQVVGHLARAAVKDPMNTNIPTIQTGKVGLGEKDGRFRSGFAAQIVGRENLPEGAQERVYKALEYYFGIEINKEYLSQNGIKLSKFRLDNPTIIKSGIDEIFKTKANPNNRILNSRLAEMIGGKATAVQVFNEESGEMEWEEGINYPVMLRIGRNYYTLDKVDGHKLALEGIVERPTVGQSAEYKRVDQHAINSTSNGIAWSAEMMEEYGRYTSDKATKHITIEKSIDEVGLEVEAPTVEVNKPTVEEVKKFTRSSVEKDTNKVYLFGDNVEDAKTGYVPKSTQAQIRGLSNAIGISTKKNRGTKEESYLSNADLAWFIEHVDQQIDRAIATGKTIVIPADGIGTGKADLYNKSKKAFWYLQGRLNQLKNGITPGLQEEKIFEWNRPSAARGTDADVAMREAADSAIVEMKTDKKQSSSKTTFDQVGEDGNIWFEKESKRYVGQTRIGTIETGKGGIINNYGKVVMLARNGALRGTELDQVTKDEILTAHGLGATFVVGSMKGVDSQFHEYLNKIGASYTIYGHSVKENESGIIEEGNMIYASDLGVAKELHDRGTGVYTMRVTEKQYKAGFAPNHLTPKLHFGNPFTGTNKAGAIQVEGGIEGAVQAFEDWLDGKAHKEVEPERRSNVLKAIEIMKNKGRKLIYFKAGYRSHADVLDERINGAKSKKVVKKEGSRIINENDTDAFNDMVKQKGGRLPETFFTATSVFKQLYNNQLGKAQPMPQSAIWIKNGNELYDMVDQETGEMIYTDVDLKTGKQIDVTLASEEIKNATEDIKIPYNGQTYIIKGTQIFNSKGKEVFKANSSDRRKIIANFRVLQGQAEVVQITEKKSGKDVQVTYVVNNNNKVMSTATGNFIVQENIVKKAIAAADVKRAAKAQGNPNNVQKPDQDDINNCK